MRGALVFTVLAGLVSLPAPGSAVTKDVEITDNAFSPRTIRIAPGDGIHWRRDGTGNQHNVAQDRGLFRSGAPTGGPINYTVVFSAGTFPYFCEVHGAVGGVGMSGVVRVPVRISKKPAGRPFTVRWATKGSQTGDTYRVQYRVGKGSWRTWKAATSGLKGVFGKGGKPVNAKKGKTYAFRVRSSDGADGASRFSPQKRFTV